MVSVLHLYCICYVVLWYHGIMKYYVKYYDYYDSDMRRMSYMNEPFTRP